MITAYRIILSVELLLDIPYNHSISRYKCLLFSLIKGRLTETSYFRIFCSDCDERCAVHLN